MINEWDSSKIHLGNTDASAEEAGYDSNRLEKLDQLFLSLIQQKKLQCAGYLLSRKGKVFAHKAMGELSGLSAHKPYMPDSIRRIASITKTFTAVAVMRLLEDGKIYLDQPIHTMIEEFNNPIHKEITVFHLLTHTSGIAGDPGSFLEPFPRGWWEGPENQTWIRKILTGPLQCKPGKEWIYSSSAFAILGEIVSRVSGIHYDEFLRQTIFEPLGMKRTFFDVPAHLHDEVCIITDWDRERLVSTEPRTHLPPRAGGGLYSTMADLCLFGQMLLNNGELGGQRILGRKTIEAMTRNHLFDVPAFQWGSNMKSKTHGLGFGLTNGTQDMSSPETFNHEGAGRCALYIDPIEQFIAVYMVPTPLDWVPESLINARNIIWSGIQ